MVGTVVAQRYRIEGPLAAGGSAHVYRATDLASSRPVALKILDRAAAADPALRALFVREARALAGLAHPNIVPIYGGGESNGAPFIVMELVDGPSLAERVAQGPLPVTDAIRIAMEVAGALAFAHAKGIVHADLKPSNVLLTQDGSAKVCDFGIARSLRDDADTPEFIATARYVAPERVEGRGATPSTDVYGLGLLIYEMLVGKPPFTSTQASVLLRDHVLRTPIPPSHLRPSLSRKLDEVVRRALAKSPELRYAGMRELAEALERASTATPQLMARPIADFVPLARQSPVVALLSAHGEPIRNAFFGALAALPLAALGILAGLGIPAALVAGGATVAIALTGQLGLALAVAWVAETALIFLFVPGIAVFFALLGLWIWLREVPAERAALALAMPVAAPFGFGPALALSAAAVFGLGGVATAAWGAALAVLAGIAVGRPTYGPFVATGLALERESLFDFGDASGAEAAFVNLLRNSGDRFGALRATFDPATLWSQVADLGSRVGAADVTLVATVLSWTAAALMVWAVTRVLRTFFDTLLRSRKSWFALYVFATGAGVTAGAALLYLVFATWGPLLRAAGRSSEDALLAAAAGGAVIALAVGVVIAAIEKGEAVTDDARLPGLGGGRL